MDLVDVSAVVSARVGGRVPEPHELGEETSRLLAEHNAGERRVLALQTHPGMQHNGHQEARLAHREPELGDGVGAVFELHQTNSIARSRSWVVPPVLAFDPLWQLKPDFLAAAARPPR